MVLVNFMGDFTEIVLQRIQECIGIKVSSAVTRG